MKLRGYRAFGDILVVRGQRIAHKAEGADPDPGAHVNIAKEISAMGSASKHREYSVRVGIQNRPARWLAGHRLILQQRGIGLLLQRGVDSADGDHKAGRFL